MSSLPEKLGLSNFQFKKSKEDFDFNDNSQKHKKNKNIFKQNLIKLISGLVLIQMSFFIVNLFYLQNIVSNSLEQSYTIFDDYTELKNFAKAGNQDEAILAFTKMSYNKLGISDLLRVDL